MHNDNRPALSVSEMADSFQGNTLPVVFMALDGPRHIGTILVSDFEAWTPEVLVTKIDAIMLQRGLTATSITRMRTYAGRPVVICHA